MNILILEDNDDRIVQFKDRLDCEGVKLHIIKTVPECISALKTENWDYLFLDHDLNGKVFVPSGGKEPTGWDVAKWLSQNPSRKPQNIILHSLNEWGRKNMKALLPEAQVVPFAWNLIDIADKEGDTLNETNT